MGWKNYGWVASIRGVEPHERNVLWYLANAAGDDDGIGIIRIPKLSAQSETPRRRLFQILDDLENKKRFIERIPRYWDKATGAPRVGMKGIKAPGKTVPNAYKLRRDRFFPYSKETAAAWREILARLRPRNHFAPGIFRVYLDSIQQAHFVKRTGALCLLTTTSDQAQWIRTEALAHIREIGATLEPPVLSIVIFNVPAFSDD